MIELNYKQLLDIVKGRSFPEVASEDMLIKGLSIDSRKIKPHNLFIAIKGDKLDGHDFIKEAIDNGSSCVILNEERFSEKEKYPISSTKGIRAVLVDDTRAALQELAKWYRSRFRPKILSITGTNGKTTTKEMIAEVLSKRYKVLRSAKSYNNQIGVPLTLLELTSETEILVLELGMNQPGEIGILTKMVEPDFGLITNIGPAHLEYMGSLEKIALAKYELLEKMDKNGVIILNADDPFLFDRAKKEKRKVYTYGIRNKADFVAVDVVQNGNGFYSFSVNRKIPINLKLLGKHNVYNALAAFSAGSILGIENEEIKEALMDYSPFELRMEHFTINGIKIINDSYNANPVSMEIALETLKGMKSKGRKIAILGDMLELGVQSIEFHKKVGEKVIECGIDYLFTYGDLSSYIAQSAGNKGLHKTNIYSFKNKNTLLGNLLEFLKHGDIVLIKGSRKMTLEDIAEGLKKLYPVKN